MTQPNEVLEVRLDNLEKRVDALEEDKRDFVKAIIAIEKHASAAAEFQKSVVEDMKQLNEYIKDINNKLDDTNEKVDQLNVDFQIMKSQGNWLQDMMKNKYFYIAILGLILFIFGYINLDQLLNLVGLGG